MSARTDAVDSYEIWTRQMYGKNFGQPETRLFDNLTADQVEDKLNELSAHDKHRWVVVHPEGHTMAGHWLRVHRGELRD